MDTGPTFRPFSSLQALWSGFVFAEGSKQAAADLLELHTTYGTVYVSPSRWDQVRLRWAFRHFRVLPPQVLSPSIQRLITRLVKTAVIAPAGRVSPDRVFGIVENVRYEVAPPTAPAARTRASAHRVAAIAPEPPRERPSKPIAAREKFSGRSRSFAIDFSAFTFKRRRRFTGDVRSSQWGALGVLAAIC